MPPITVLLTYYQLPKPKTSTRQRYCVASLWIEVELYSYNHRIRRRHYQDPQRLSVKLTPQTTKVSGPDETRPRYHLKATLIYLHRCMLGRFCCQRL